MSFAIKLHAFLLRQKIRLQYHAKNMMSFSTVQFGCWYSGHAASEQTGCVLLISRPLYADCSLNSIMKIVIPVLFLVHFITASNMVFLCNRAHLRSTWNSAHERAARYNTSPMAVSFCLCQHPTNCPEVRPGNCEAKQRSVVRFMEWNIENNGAPSASGRKRAQDSEIRSSAGPKTMGIVRQ